MIETQAQSITRDYSKRFRSSGAQTARQAAGQTAGALAGGFGPAGAALGTAISSGIEVGLGVVKFSEAADDFEPKLMESIRNVAAGTPGTAELMRMHLARHENSLINTKASAIMMQLSTTSFVVSGEINYNNCQQIATSLLGGFASFVTQLIASCTEINRLMSREAQSVGYTQLEESLRQTLFAGLQSSLKEIASSASSVAASAAAGLITNPIQKHLSEAQERIFAESKGHKALEEAMKAAADKNSGKPKTPAQAIAEGQKSAGQTSGQSKKETLTFTPMSKKGKTSGHTNAQLGSEKKISYKHFKDSVLSRPEWKETRARFASGRTNAFELAAFEDYLRATYSQYRSGRTIESIGITNVGFDFHRLSFGWLELTAEYKWLDKGSDWVGEKIDQLHDAAIKPIVGKLVDGVVIGGHVLHDAVGATQCLFSSGCNLKAQAHASIDQALAEVFAPVARAINEWKNDLTPAQREVMLPFLDRVGKIFDLGGATAVAKSTLTGAIRTVLPASARTLEAAAAKTAALGAGAVRTPFARAAAKALDKTVDAFKATTASVKAECASAARNLDDLLTARLGRPAPALAGASLRVRPTMPPSPMKPVSLARIADDAAMPGRTAVRVHTPSATAPGTVTPHASSVSNIPEPQALNKAVFEQYFGSKINLDLHEGGSWGGHTKKLHISTGSVAQDQIVLANRLVSENLEIATVFKDQATAERVISDVLKHRAKEIQRWMDNPGAQSERTFSKIFEEPAGYGLRKGSNTIEDFNQVMVRLVKTTDGLKIKVSYIAKV